MFHSSQTRKPFRFVEHSVPSPATLRHVPSFEAFTQMKPATMDDVQGEHFGQMPEFSHWANLALPNDCYDEENFDTEYPHQSGIESSYETLGESSRRHSGPVTQTTAA